MNSMSSTPRTTPQAMVDRTPKYDRIFKKKPKAGRPKKNCARQHWVK